MTEKKKSAAGSQPAAGAADTPGWKPTPEAKKQATTFRWIAAVLWFLAIAGEAVGIFWLLRQRVVIGEEGTFRRDTETGLLTGGVETQFPQWAFITLIVLLVVIAALSITGSLLWKKANRLDPARKSDTVRFFVQNQLGAIIAIIAFLPLVILIFLNKDMDKGQKTTAGIIGVVLAAVAVFFGIDFKPSSVEQYDADQSTVIQLLGKDQVVWVDGGKVYHVCDQVPDIQTGSDKRTGTTAEAVAAGKLRLTLRFASEMKTCGLTVPENSDEITAALREIQNGKESTPLPVPVWTDPTKAPIVVKDAPAN
ncbi:hypothetical protein [Microbacterium sp.]|uniref:hypothetical protein n=1 Tax=Microbacterium sp. TaxID=51671 RepID=UPI0033414EE2